MLKIMELRRKAEGALGPKFDTREYHAQVLMSGALPLSILDQKIDRWIAERKAGTAPVAAPASAPAKGKGERG